MLDLWGWLWEVVVDADGGRGGAGAGPDWDGQSCVHVHMTNVSDATLLWCGLMGLVLVDCDWGCGNDGKGVSGHYTSILQATE